MPEQPQYFTLIDVIFEILFLLFITAGCYYGYQLGGTFLSLFFGGAAGRYVLPVLFLLFRKKTTNNN